MLLARLSLSICVTTTLLIAPIMQSTAHPGGTPTSKKEETQKLYSRKEAYRASTGRIVLHYGKGTKRAENIAEILNDRGYPAVAYPGGPEGLVELFIHRGIAGKYNQDSIDDGELGGNAIMLYEERVASTRLPNAH